jgi:hypothetical protein
MRTIKSIFYLIIIIVYNTNLQAQTLYLQMHEQAMFSFKTTDYKTISLNKDLLKNCLIFRMGNDEAVLLQYPEKAEDKEMKFTYSFYLRGGGEANEGMELNYIYFILNGIKYVIYENAHWSEKQKNVGLKMIEMTTSKTTSLIANSATVKGNLMQFRNTEIVQLGDEIFD